MSEPGLRIGSLRLASNLCLSPLAGYTDLAFRRLVRSLGGLGLATTEVISARAVIHGSRRTDQYARSAPDDRPLAVQIDGGSGEDLAEAARFLEQTGRYAAIDINMGCPVPKITQKGGGAAWTCEPTLAAEAVAAVARAVRLPVTAKMRLGWDDGSLTAPELARACAEAGAAAIFVHGRTRAQGFGGEVSLDGIAAVVAAVKDVPVIGNGDVVSTGTARAMLARTGCAGVSIGRAALTDPWIFARIAAELADRAPAPAPTYAERVALIRRHYALLLEQDGERRGTLRFRRAAVWYGTALGLSREYRRRLVHVASAADVAALLDDVEAGKLRSRSRGGPQPAQRVAVPAGPVDRW